MTNPTVSELQEQINALNLQKEKLYEQMDEMRIKETSKLIKEIKPVKNEYCLTFEVRVKETLTPTDYPEYKVKTKCVAAECPVGFKIPKKDLSNISVAISEMLEETLDSCYIPGSTKYMKKVYSFNNNLVGYEY